MDLSPVELRVLGSLLEKQRTTPDAYPLTLNALRLACNQATNRDPVVDYGEPEIRDALDRLRQRGFTRLTSGHASRVAKFRHLLDDALGLGRDELALLCVLILRGPQTPGELKQRTERLHDFAALDGVSAALERLIERGLVARHPRRPGQKEERYEQLLGESGAERGRGRPRGARRHGGASPPAGDGLGSRMDGLERRVAELEEALASLRSDLGA